MKYGLIGETLGHSMSVPIHTRLGLYEYCLCPLKQEELDLFLRRRDFSGINVTIPYKKAVIPYCTKLSREAELCGAVNTIVHRDGELFGYNTDFLGLKALTEKLGVDVREKNVLILGSGGTAGTARALCRHLGASRIDMVSRSGKDGCISYEAAIQKTDTQVIFNTTPCGMFPNMGKSPIDLAYFPRLFAVLDAVYNPLQSQLVLDAKKRGIKAMGGLYMLVSQAIFSAVIWTGRQDLTEQIDPIYEAMFKTMQNIVLVGMPGVGKTTLGKKLAEKLGKTFFDSDEEIVKQAGISIPEIFARDGEKGFRDLEEEVISALSAKQNALLATGGGAVLRQANVDHLKGNGILIFLDAPPETLLATSNRPLSSTPAALHQRYEERYDRYCSVCDIHVSVTRDVEENLAKIWEKII